VALAINNFLENKEFFVSMGEVGRKWYQKYGIEKPLNVYMDILKYV
jgi:hypothetical protein